MLQRGLSHLHHIAAMYLAAGYTPADISQVISLTPQYISRLSSNPMFALEVERLRQQIQSAVISEAGEMIKNEALASLRTIKNIRDDCNIAPGVRMKAAESFLDRNHETSKIHKQSTTPRAPEFSDEQTQQILDFLNDDPLAMEAFKRAALTDSQSIIDADFNNVPASNDSEIETEQEPIYDGIS